MNMYMGIQHTQTHTYIYIYIYIRPIPGIYIESKVSDLVYIYIVLFSPVKPELGVIHSGQENHSRAEHLDFPGRELNVINFTVQYFL